MPRFSIILVHYQGATPHSDLCRAVASIRNQTCRDFELLAYHDGPLLDTSLPLPVDFICMDRNYHDWGHTLRDRGIREARGDYIVHFNSDDILYPNALEEISKCIDRPPRIFDTATGRVQDTADVIVFSIIGHGLQRFQDAVARQYDHPEYCLILTGNPPRPLSIDAMQVVMKRELWLAEGGWYERSMFGDGVMYEQFALKYGYRSVEMILGEHF